MTDPEFWPGAEVIGYQIVVDDQGTIVLMLRFRGGGGATVAWPMGVLMARDLGADLHEAAASAVEMGNLCRDCGRRHERPERPDTDVQLPADFDERLQRLVEEESGGEH